MLLLSESDRVKPVIFVHYVLPWLKIILKLLTSFDFLSNLFPLNYMNRFRIFYKRCITNPNEVFIRIFFLLSNMISFLFLCISNSTTLIFIQL